ncbi:MAG TPA: hypothetical protein VFI38_05910 [Candidatus Acidoferrum sp.]|nr:hypothetical protein [Candidatus Acidoferrum sp.]
MMYLGVFGTYSLRAQSLAVRHSEGVTHGFLRLRNLENETLAVGDLIQNSTGDRVTSQVILHFKDGSVHDERVSYSQKRRFRMLEYRLSQKGPAFKTQIELFINGTSGEVTVRSWDEKGKEKVETSHEKLPADLANGMIPILTKNLPADGSAPALSLLVATPKPRLTKLEIAREGEDSFGVGGSSRKATRYVVKIKIEGAAGIVAPLIGKAPPDIHVWVLEGEAPTFLKSEGPLYEGGPVWRIELISPEWAKADSK